jgi:hypothetical protein
VSAPAGVSRARRALAFIGAVVVVAGTLAVAVAAFTLSYDAIRSVGIAANTRASWAWMLPVSIDGAMGVATVAVLLLKQLGRSTWYPWVVVATGVLVSAGCNGLHAGGEGGHLELPGQSARAVGVIPPLMLALSVHLLAVLVKALSGSEQTRPNSDLPAPVEAEQAPLSAPLPPPIVARTGVTEQTGQFGPDRSLDTGQNRVSTGVDTPRTGRTEQAPAAEPVRRPSPRPERTEHAPDLRGHAEQVAPLQAGQETGRDSEQTEERPRPDDELITLVREQAAEQIADGTLKRYRVEKITGASARQANRVLDAVMSDREQDTEQTELAGASR